MVSVAHRRRVRSLRTSEETPSSLAIPPRKWAFLTDVMIGLAALGTRRNALPRHRCRHPMIESTTSLPLLCELHSQRARLCSADSV